MKKVISILTVLCIIICVVPAFAQGETGAKSDFVERITKIAEEEGGEATFFGDDIVVKKGNKNLIITKDTVIYMDNGVMVRENLCYENGFIKLPEKALESVLGSGVRKSEAYREKLEYLKTGVYYTEKTIDTEYGTIVEYGTGGVMHATTNQLRYIRYDGKSVQITTSSVPHGVYWIPLKYESIEISEDGKTAVVTYPEIKETVIFSPDAENRKLKEKGRMIVTVDLVNCTAEYENHSLEEEEAPKEAIAGGALEGLGMTNNEPFSLKWSYSDGVLTISGTGSSPAYSTSYGSGRWYSPVTEIKKPKEWQAYFDEIEKIVLTDEEKTIKNGLFKECVNVKSIVIGKMVTFNDNSFMESEKLESVILSENVRIGEAVFKNCDKLTHITLYDGVSLGEGAFYGCDNLNVEFKSNNVTLEYSALNDTAFYNNTKEVYYENELVWMNDNLKAGDVRLKEGITKIPDYMFRDSLITSIEIPQSVKIIGRSAFEGCGQLKRVTFPKDNDFLIKAFAFEGTGIEHLTITKNMTFGTDQGPDEGRIFAGCTKLKTVTVEEGVTLLAPYIFGKCMSLCDVTLPETLKEVPQGAFYYCKALKGIDLPCNITAIGDGAFCDSGLLSIVVPENAISLGAGVFSYCYSLENVDIKAKIEAIPSSAFYGCESLGEIILPDTITEIGTSAFSNCKIKSITLPESLKIIKMRAFNHADTEEIIIPEGCEIIEEQAFAYSKIRKIFIPGSIKEVPKEAFAYSKKLNTVTIGEGVEALGTRTFEECDALESVVLPYSINSLGYETFKWCDNLKRVNIPRGVTQIPENFVAGCVKLTDVVIENENLESIGRGAFSGCGLLKNIDIPKNLQAVGFGALDKTPLWEDKENWKGEFFIIGDVLFGVREEALGEKVVIPRGVRVLPSLGFSSNETIREVVVPEGVKVLPYGVFYNCPKLERVILPDTLERIEKRAFVSSPKLDETHIPDSVSFIDEEAFKSQY